MGAKIEFHLLQSFPPANLNRDDTNTPKDCEFGGVRRARISSQCLKRAVRQHPDFGAATGVEPASRTRLLAGNLKDLLVAGGRAEEEAAAVARKFTEALLGKMDTKSPDRSAVLFFISAQEKEALVSQLDADWENAREGKFDPIIKDYRKRFQNRSSAPDIALFGRMLADGPDLNLDAACQVSHAISTHRVNMEIDFFTAVDDLQPKAETGAGMMGVTAFNSATFYRYAAIDWDQLMANLDGNRELARCTVQGFLRALVKAVPSGKQNSFAAQTPPGFVLVVVRSDGQAWSLANAFEKPVTAPRSEGGYLAPSAAALARHWARLERVYGDPQRPARAAALALDEIDLPEGLEAAGSLAELEARVLAAMAEV